MPVRREVRRARWSAVTAIAGCTLVLSAPSAQAHGSCTDTPQIPGMGGSIGAPYVDGGNTYQCTGSHYRMLSCVHLEWRATPTSAWTPVTLHVCNEGSNSTYEYVSTIAECRTGGWRSIGRGEAYNSSGVLVHSATAASAERIIVQCTVPI